MKLTRDQVPRKDLCIKLILKYNDLINNRIKINSSTT